MNIFKAVLPILMSFCLGTAAQAGVKAYTGDGDEKLFIEAAPKLGKNVYLVKFEGIESKWAGKVIKTEQTKDSTKERYNFEYEEELSNGVHKKTYGIITEAGATMIKGTLIPMLNLHYQESAGKPEKMKLDAELTKASQKINLQEEYKKSPYKPEVD